MTFNNAHRLIFLFTMATLSAYAQHDEKPFDYGKVENSIYRNSFFDFEMTLPTDWFVQDKEVVDKISDKGKDMISGDNAQMKSVLDASDVRTANLLTVYQFELGSNVDFNPSVIVISENVKQLPSIRSGSDYLFASQQLLAQSQVKYDEIDEDFEKQKIYGIDFYTMNASITYKNQKIRQVFYSRVTKGFAFNVIISYVTKEQKKQLLAILSTMKFQE
jgi:hypothetical protein